MDNNEALNILTKHNLWRRGLTDVREYGVEKLGEAIDTAISALSLCTDKDREIMHLNDVIKSAQSEIARLRSKLQDCERKAITGSRI